MAPNDILLRDVEYEEKKKLKPGYEVYDEKEVKYHKLKTDFNYKHKWNPIMVFTVLVVHIGALYGVYLIVTSQFKLQTLIYVITLGVVSYAGSALGAHRCYSHNSFKLTTLGEILMVTAGTIGGQYHIFWWAEGHRLHHKFCDTDADPYNAKRGFFFAHVGWLMMHKHPLVDEKMKTIDLSDLEANKIIMFQKKYFFPLFFSMTAITTLIPVYAWDESLWRSFFIAFLYRYGHVLNATWCINSVAHLYGTKAFDTRISARQSRLAYYIAWGEGWHNFHHAFPYHHTINEFGFDASVATYALNLMKKLGLAYDFKSVPYNVIYKHYKRYGDGSIPDHLFNLKTE